MSRTRRIFLVTFLGLLIIAIADLAAVQYVSSTTNKRVASIISAVGDSTKEGLNLWFRDRQNEVSGWAQSQNVVSLTERLLEISPDQLQINPLQGDFKNVFSPLSMEDHTIAYYIISPDNIMLASSIEQEIGAGTQLSKYPVYFAQLFSGQSFIGPPIQWLDKITNETRAVILAGSPIINSAGDLIAGLIISYDPQTDFSEILQNGRILSSGETYAVNADGVMASESRFDVQLRAAGIIAEDEPSILNITIKDPGPVQSNGDPVVPVDKREFTKMAASLIRHGSDVDVNGYRDYRGVEVVGAWSWLDEYGFGIATEVDKSEAFFNLTAIRIVSTILGVVSAIAVVGTVWLTNMSEQRELQAQKRYEQTVEGAMEAIISFDSNSNVTAWNRHAELMFGWSKQEALGKSMVGKMMPPETAQYYLQRLEELRADKDFLMSRQRGEVEMLRKGGNRFPVDVFLVPTKIGNDEGVSAVIRDLTDIKEAQAQVQRSHKMLERSYDATLRGWSQALDLRDDETEGHTLRVTEATMKLAKVMGVPKTELVDIYRGSLLHDIGKIGIPDSVLLKPGPLTEEEWKIMQRHPVYAREMLKGIPYLRRALDIPYAHHEKWNGTGYPRGLKGKHIPFSARMFSIVDVWDALSSDRPYRKAWPKKEVLEHIRTQSGTHFDPVVVEAFITLQLDNQRKK